AFSFGHILSINICS
ncbi:Hypothetical protein EIN_432320, partial [Entamoeba invadens IP1]